MIAGLAPEVWVALVGVPASLLLGVASVIQAMAAKTSARGARADIATNNGKRPGEYLELIHSDLAELRMIVVDHITDTELHRIP